VVRKLCKTAKTIQARRSRILIDSELKAQYEKIKIWFANYNGSGSFHKLQG
jgi:hypothetical protein